MLPSKNLLIVAAIAGAVLATPAIAAENQPPTAFARLALTDDVLDSVHGTGIVRPTLIRTVARDEFEAFGRQSAQTLPVTFDNWFNDVGTPLIVANLSR